MEKFADDLENQNNVHTKESKGIKNHNILADKWNEIQDEYLKSQPNIDVNDLYFEGGGFEGMLTKISELTGRSVDEIKKEIEEW